MQGLHSHSPIPIRRVPPAPFYLRSSYNGAIITPCTTLLLTTRAPRNGIPPAPYNLPLHPGSAGLSLLPPVLAAPCHTGGPRPCPPPGLRMARLGLRPAAPPPPRCRLFPCSRQPLFW